MLYDGLIIDMDGIMLNSENTVKRFEDIKAIKSLINRYIPVVIYTERDKEYAKKIIEDFDIREPAIIMEGAAIYSPFEEEFNFNFHLSSRTVRKLCSWGEKNNISSRLMADSGMIKYDKWSLALEKFTLDDEELYECSLINEIIMDIASDKVIAELYNYVCENEIECYTRIYDGHNVHFRPKVDKGKALRCLAKKKNWDIKKFMAIGKCFNDSSLFEEVGLGVSISANEQEKNDFSEKELFNNDSNVLKKCIEYYF